MFGGIIDVRRKGLREKKTTKKDASRLLGLARPTDPSVPRQTLTECDEDGWNPRQVAAFPLLNIAFLRHAATAT
jgi:hypothetical protein